MNNGHLAIPVAVAGMLLLAGCLSGLGDFSDTGQSEAPTPPPMPERPDQFTNESVSEYVQTYERAIQFRDLTGTEVESVDVQCDAPIDFVTERGYYVTVACAVEKRTDGVGHGVTDPVVYFVNDTETTRVESRSMGVDTYTGPNGTDAIESHLLPGYTAVNFDDEQNNVNVTVTHLNTTANDPVFTHELSLGSASGIEREDLVRTPRTYRISVLLDDGTANTFDWQIRDEKTQQRVTIYITKRGDVRIRPLPANEFLCC